MAAVRGDIAAYVRSATVAVVARAPGGDEMIVGSGFFIAPGVVFTCAHVVLEAGTRTFGVHWNERTHDVQKFVAVPDQRTKEGPLPFPDTAIVTLDAPPEHPCVPLTDGTDPQPDQPLLALGYTDVRVGEREPDSSLLRFVDRTGKPGEQFLRLAGGHIGKGLSGGPLLDLKRRAVCGMTKSALGSTVNYGGHAVPIDGALAVGDAVELRAQNEKSFGRGLVALRREQVGFGVLPTLVAAQLTGVVPALVVHLQGLGVSRPVELADDDLPEWVARELFACSVNDLMQLLEQVGPTLGRSVVDVAEAVVCCLPPDDGLGSAWVAADAAEALRLEWARERPRVARVNSDFAATVDLVLRRAFRRRVPVTAPLPVNAAVGGDGLSAQLQADLVASLAHAYRFDPEKWAKNVPKLLDRMRGIEKVACLDAHVLTDAGLLAALLDAFAGLRFLVYSRDVPAPPGATHVVLDLQPPVDEYDEDFVLGRLDDLRERHLAVS